VLDVNNNLHTQRAREKAGLETFKGSTDQYFSEEVWALLAKGWSHKGVKMPLCNPTPYPPHPDRQTDTCAPLKHAPPPVEMTPGACLCTITGSQGTLPFRAFHLNTQGDSLPPRAPAPDYKAVVKGWRAVSNTVRHMSTIYKLSYTLRRIIGVIIGL